jgi:hypothetical protein
MGTGYKGQPEETSGCGYSAGDEVTPKDLGFDVPEGDSGIVTSCTGSSEILMPPMLSLKEDADWSAMYDWIKAAHRGVPTDQSCEIDTDGKLCGKPAYGQSLFAFNMKASRHAWVCDEHSRELNEYVRKLPVEPATEEEIRDAEGDG